MRTILISGFMQGYNTRQKQLVISFFEDNYDRDFTVAEAADRLKGEVGFSSVYRIIASLSAEGKLKKFYREGNAKAAVYCYFDCHSCCNHLHLKCGECGVVTHLSEKDTVAIMGIIGDNFAIDNQQTTMYGTCQDCKKGKI